MDFSEIDNVSLESCEEAPMTIDTLVDRLWLATGEDGTLRIPYNMFYEGLCALDDEDEERMVCAKINWTEEKKEALKQKLCALMTSIEEGQKETPFLTPMPLFEKQDEVEDLFERLTICKSEANLTKEEWNLLEDYDKERSEFAEQVLGKKPMAYECMLRAGRVYRLLELQAPESVVNHEKKHLIEAVTLYLLAESVEVDA